MEVAELLFGDLYIEISEGSRAVVLYMEQGALLFRISTWSLATFGDLYVEICMLSAIVLFLKASMHACSAWQAPLSVWLQ